MLLMIDSDSRPLWSLFFSVDFILPFPDGVFHFHFRLCITSSSSLPPEDLASMKDAADDIPRSLILLSLCVYYLSIFMLVHWGPSSSHPAGCTYVSFSSLRSCPLPQTGLLEPS